MLEPENELHHRLSMMKHSFVNWSVSHHISGFFWRELMSDTGAEEEAWKFLAVCVPIVVFFAPFGSFLSSHFHRQVLAALIYILDTIALVSNKVSNYQHFFWIEFFSDHCLCSHSHHTQSRHFVWMPDCGWLHFLLAHIQRWCKIAGKVRKHRGSSSNASCGSASSTTAIEHYSNSIILKLFNST